MHLWNVAFLTKENDFYNVPWRFVNHPCTCTTECKECNSGNKTQLCRVTNAINMEKTFSKIKTLKSRRKLSLPASPALSSSAHYSANSLERNNHNQRRVSDVIFDFESEKSESKRIHWSPALLHRRSKSPTPPLSSSTQSHEDEEEENDIFLSTDSSSAELKAMRKSLRSRSVCSAASPPSNNYSLYAGLKGVNSIVAVTGSHISGRRLSAPGADNHHCTANYRRPSLVKATQRSKRSESATTVEEEASKLRAYMASRHASLPVVVVNDSRNYLYTNAKSKIQDANLSIARWNLELLSTDSYISSVV